MFTPVQVTDVACYVAGPLNVRLSLRSQNVPPPTPKTLHNQRYRRSQFITTYFSQLTNTVLTLLTMIIALSEVHCELKYQHWPMK